MNLVFGMVIGYIFVSFWEAFYHKLGGHLGFFSAKTWKKVPMIGKIVIDRHFSHHIVHHCMTYRSKYTVQFTDRAEREAVDRRLLLKNKEHVIAQDYGRRIGDGVEYYWYLAPTAPFVILLAWLSGDVYFSLGLLMPLLAMPLMSEYLHPMYHLNKAEACSHQNAFLRQFAKTKLFDTIWIYHWLHHKNPKINFNIMIGAGDYLLGTHKKATALEYEAAMKDLYSQS